MEHKYVTLDGKVIRETYGNVTVDYFYDNDGNPLKIEVNDNGTSYTGYYVLNQQGDVIAIIDVQGNVLVRYYYNAWGLEVAEYTGARSTDHPLRQYNALKYRGYYYDGDLGLYYLGSRYFDPVICRFISPDGEISEVGGDIRGYNIYSYCMNNPVNMSDPSGNWPSWANKIFTKVKQAVTSTVNKVKKFVSKHVGIAVNIGKEKTTYKQYYGVATYESGIGYNKNFATGKSVNAYINIPENPFEIWEYAGVIDVNINGMGFSLQKGTENAIAIHMKSNSFELGTNMLGRVYGKHTYTSGDGYAYNKISINLPELVAVAAVVMYAPGVAGAVGTAGATIQLFK